MVFCRCPPCTRNTWQPASDTNGHCRSSVGIAFTLMTIRVIQVNYYKLVKGIDIRDPEAEEIDQMVKSETEHKTEVEELLESESKKKSDG